MTIIAMTREMGTLGKEVARIFARRMNYTVIHTELIESATARDARTEESEVYRFLEGTPSELEYWRTNRDRRGFLTPDEVCEIAAEGDVLIRGWGAARLLRSVPNVLSVRVCAPMSFRTDQMIRRLGVGEAAARREIERSDASHSGLFARFFGAKWEDPLNYDLVLNTEHMLPETCAQILIDTLASGRFNEGEKARQRLFDIVLKSRIEAVISNDDKLRHHGRHIQVSVKDSNVLLFGVVTHDQTRIEIERMVSEQAGVAVLQNNIVRAQNYAD